MKIHLTLLTKIVGISLFLTTFSLEANSQFPKISGQIIWQETFSADQWSSSINADTTVISNLPSGWAFTDSTGNRFYWQWTQQGPRGRFTSPNAGLVPRDQLLPATPIASTTAANGFLLMPSDWYNTNTDGTATIPAVPMNSTFEYGPVDLSAFPTVHFRMEYFFRLIKPVGASIIVSFRTADGSARYSLEIPFQENVPSLNAQLLDIDLSNTPLVGKSDVYFSVTQRGSSRYFFMSDDIAFYQPLDRDIRIENQWVDYRLPGPLNVTGIYANDYFGGYKNLPIGLTDSFRQTRTAVINFGGLNRQNLKVTQTIENIDLPSLNPMLTSQSQPFELTIGQRDTITTPLDFRPLQLGRYKLTSTVTDGQPEDATFNTTQSFFTITNSLYSYVDTAFTQGQLFVDADSSSLAYGFGQLFWVPDLQGNNFQITHAGFKIHSQQSAAALSGDPKIQVKALLFRKSGTNFELVQQSAIYEPTTANIGKNVILAFENPQNLEGNRDYYLVFNVLNQTTTRRLRFAYNPDHITSHGRSSILLMKNNTVASLQTTFAFFAICSGGYVPRETNILSFTIPNQVGNTQINSQQKTVTVNVLPGTNLTQLVPEFILSYGAQAFIANVQQVSGTSAVDFTNPVTYSIVNGPNTTLWTVTVNTLVLDANILAFSIPGQTAPTTINTQERTVLVNLPYSADLSSLIPTFVLSPGATAYVNDIEQISGVTANNFTNPVVYVVRNLGDIEKTWTVTVTKPNEPSVGTQILSFGFTGQTQPSIINSTSREIWVNMPSNTNLSILVPLFTLSPGAKAYVGQTQLISGANIVDFTNPRTIRVVAENNVDHADWTVTVTKYSSDQADFLSLSVKLDMDGDTNPDTTFHATIYPANKRMELHLPNYLPIDSIVPYWTVSPGARVFIVSETNETEMFSGVTKVKLAPQIQFRVKSQSEGKPIATWILYTYRSLVGIEENVTLDKLVRVYPNPVRQTLCCELPEEMRNGEYTFINITGQNVLHGNYRGMDFQVDVSTLPSGIYFIKIQSKRNQIIRAISIQQ